MRGESLKRLLLCSALVTIAGAVWHPKFWQTASVDLLCCEKADLTQICLSPTPPVPRFSPDSSPNSRFSPGSFAIPLSWPSPGSPRVLPRFFPVLPHITQVLCAKKAQFHNEHFCSTADSGEIAQNRFFWKQIRAKGYAIVPIHKVNPCKQ